MAGELPNSKKTENKAHLFKPGQSGNPSGRPKGALDKSWATLQFWYEKLEEYFPLLEAKDAANISMKMFELILAKKQLPPDTPSESVQNAMMLMGELKAIEDANRKEALGTGDKAGVDNRDARV